MQRQIIQGLILTLEVAWVALGRYFSNTWGNNRRLPMEKRHNRPPCHFRFRRLHAPYRRRLTIHARLIDGRCRDCQTNPRGFFRNRRYQLQPWQWIRRG